MSMKKIIAGVAAAALTVSSLAVVGVSADATTKTFNFVGKTGTMTISYNNTVGFRGGYDREDIFQLTDPAAEYEFDYTLGFEMKDGYKTENASDVANLVKAVTTGKGTVITVTGTNGAGRSVSSKATCKIVKDKDNKPVSETFTVRWEGDTDGVTLQKHELDLTNMVTITSISVSNEFSVNTGNYGVREGVANIKVGNNLVLEDPKLDLSDNGSYKSTVADGDGKVITTHKIFTFEGKEGDPSTVLDNNGSWGDSIVGESLGHNLLRWTNDNIVQNRGAKLRINFMTPEQLKDAIDKGNLTAYPTVDADWSKWEGTSVLVPDSSSSASTMDIMIGVNLQNTTKLQQATNINNYVAEFDWDTLVQNSASTVSGNVDSIAIRVNDSANVKDNIGTWDGKKLDNNGNKVYDLAIRSIEIVIPEQSTVAPVDEVIEVEDPVSGVKASGTASTIRGNGGAILQAIGKLTSSNLTYEVKLLDKDSKAVQPAGEVTLTLPIPKDNQGKTIKGGTVAHGLSNGTVENLPIVNIDTYKTDGFVKVVTKSFSPFTITFATFGMDFEEDETTTEATEATTEAPADTTEATEATTEAPAQTGSTNGGEDKNVGTGVVLAVVPAAIAAAAVVISKKRK